jgi:hypothetical protein
MASVGAREHRVEVLGTILLAVAALAAAWSTFQSGRWRGEQALQGAKSQAARIGSTKASTRAGQLTQVDIATFVQWVNADAVANRKLANFYRLRFRTEFKPAFDAWIATRPFTSPTAPSSPFVLPHYRLAETRKSELFDAQAAARASSAGRANDHADNYLLAVVLFASALFFAGIATKLRSLRQKEILVGLGCVIFLSTAIWVATSPFSI